jgi:hypothetical protein
MLESGNLAAGNHIARWNAVDVPSGVYFAMLSAGEFRAVRKLMLLK